MAAYLSLFAYVKCHPQALLFFGVRKMKASLYPLTIVKNHESISAVA